MLFLNREDKELLLKQKSKSIWMTGLSGSGKTTICIELEKKLNNNKYLTQIFDGDEVRAGINKDLDFSIEGRRENIRRISELNKLFINCGVLVINCFVSPTSEIRNMAKEIIGNDNIIEVYINSPIEICENRDPKGLYKLARKGLIKDFTGFDSPYEPPENPNIEIKTDILTINQSVDKLYNFIIPLISFNSNK